MSNEMKFIIGDDTNGPSLFCKNFGRQGKSLVRFEVINGWWAGTLDTETGVLTVSETKTSIKGQKIMDLGPLPQGDYNDVLEWAKKKWLEGKQ